MREYPEYAPNYICEDLTKFLPKESISTSIFERINNALDPYTFASDISRDEVPSKA